MNNKARSVSFSAALVTLLGLVLLTQPAQAQTFTVIHTFTGGVDGANPHAGLTIDGTGNLYGTAARGGVGYGTVFKLAHKNSQWMFASLYSFAGGYGGSEPYARVVIGSDDTLYGTTFAGGYGGCTYGGHFGCGTVFNVRPPASVCRISFCSWMATVLYHFTGSPPDGRNPLGDLAFDNAGNIYGKTFRGGSSRDGSVYKLAPSDGGWTESILYSFLGGNDGSNPGSGLTFDSVGNLYGTALGGGDFIALSEAKTLGRQRPSSWTTLAISTVRLWRGAPMDMVQYSNLHPRAAAGHSLRFTILPASAMGPIHIAAWHLTLMAIFTALHPKAAQESIA